MTGRDDVPGPDPTVTPEETAATRDPTLVEDLLLLLFQPGSGTIAGEGTLFYVLAGAVLADLGLAGHVRTGTGRMGTTTVAAVGGEPPHDPLLRPSWEYVAARPRGVQAVLAATGPTLREPVLHRLLQRGDIHRGAHKVLGLFPTAVLQEGDTGRRDALLAQVRSVLADGAEPTPRLAALTALVHGSGTLPQLDPEIPWTSAVITRAEALEDGTWGAGAAARAVARTVTGTVVSNVIIAAATLPRGGGGQAQVGGRAGRAAGAARVADSHSSRAPWEAGHDRSSTPGWLPAPPGAPPRHQQQEVRCAR